MPEPVATPATAQSRGALLKSARDIFWFAALAGVLLVLLHESLFLGKGLVPADGILKYAAMESGNTSVELSAGRSIL